MRLLSKVFLVAFVPMAVAAAVTVALVWHYGQRAAVEQQVQELASRLEAENQRIAGQFSGVSAILAAEGKRLLPGDETTILPALRDLGQRLGPTVDGLFWNRPDGVVIGTDGSRFDSRDRYYYPLLRRGETLVTRVIDSRAGGHRIVVVLSPQVDANGGYVGALGASVPVAELLQSVAVLPLPHEAKALLVDDTGHVAAGHADVQQHASPILATVATARRGRARLKLGGVACQVLYSRVPATPWSLALVQPEPRFPLADRPHLRLLGVVLLVTTAVAGAGLWLLQRMISRPVGALLAAQARVAAGHLDTRVEQISADELGDLAQSFNAMAAQLETSRQLVEQVLDAATEVAIITTDLAGRVVTFNTGAERLLGQPAEAAVGRSVLDAIAVYEAADLDRPEPARRLTRLADVVGRSVGQGEVELAVVRPDGQGRLLSIVINALGSPDGEPRGFLGIGRDITEQRRTELALRESEERYRGIVENMEDAYYRTDMEGVLTMISPSVLPMLGYQGVAEMVGHRSVEFYAQPERYPEFRDTLRANGVVLDYELTLLHRDGSPLPIAVTSWYARNDAGEVVGVEGIIRDIRERKRTEEVIRQSQQRLALLVERSPLAVIEWDLDFRVAAWNPAAERIFGYTRREALGRHAFDLIVPPEAQPLVGALWQRILEGSQDVHSTNANRAKSGEALTCEWYNTTLVDPHGRLIGVASLVSDITERQRAAEERERLQVELSQAQKMESVGRLAGGVAHDFNNMLGVIIGYTELLLTLDHPDEETRATLVEIHGAAERSAELTRQLLAFARKQGASPQVLDLNQAIDGTVRLLRRLIGEHVELVWRPGEDVWPVHLDPTQVDQVVANLALNARDALGEGGRIVIETGNLPLEAPHTTSLAHLPPGQYVTLTVSDTGCGMSAETLAHVFEPFFTTKAVGAGTGLGLSTVYGIVQQSLGVIDVYSEPGLGTTFRVYWPPADAATAVSGAAEAAPLEAPQGGETILIVEDERALLDFGVGLLTGLGYTVLASHSPAEALELIGCQERPIDLLLTDLVMPGMTGRDLAQRVRELRPGIRCLYMSGYSADLVTHQGALAEGAALIEKPFGIRQLATAVRQLLDRHEAEPGALAT